MITYFNSEKFNNYSNGSSYVDSNYYFDDNVKENTFNGFFKSNYTIYKCSDNIEDAKKIYGYCFI
jgi:hypothetical protein